MSTQPLFSVGETVILQSAYLPQHNGEYTVVDKTFNSFTDSRSGKSVTCWHYDLGFEAANGNKWWMEQALRKKHKPSEFGSFTNLMNNLKLPQKTPQEVK